MSGIKIRKSGRSQKIEVHIESESSNYIETELKKGYEVAHSNRSKRNGKRRSEKTDKPVQ